MSQKTDHFCKPWLPDTWGKRDIIFPKHEGDNHHSILVQIPFIAQHFSAPTCIVPSRQPPDSVGLPSPEVRNQSIFALGIVLIELWYNQPIESLRITGDFDKNGDVNQITDFATARRLTEEIYREAGDWYGLLYHLALRPSDLLTARSVRYGHAVRRCIYCDFDQRHNDLSLSSMREAVYQGVLSPLEENLRFFCGGAADELLA